MSRRAREAGFTLLEIAVALAILGIGMVACIQAFGGGLRLVDRTVRQDRAVQYARARMDRLIENPRKDKGSEDLDDGYRVAWLVRDADAGDGVEPPEEELEDAVLRYLEVDVTWQDGVGQKTYALRTLQLQNLEQEE